MRLLVVALAILLTGCVSGGQVCFDRGAAGYAIGQASHLIASRCAAKRLSEAECARLAELEAVATKALLTPAEPAIDAELLMRLLIGAAKLAI